MQPILKVVIFLLITGLSANCYPTSLQYTDTDKEEIVNVFFEYMGSISESNFLGAAKLIHPAHLEGLETHTLPVLIEAWQASKNKDNPILNTFFEGLSAQQAVDLSGVQISSRLERTYTSLRPGALEAAQRENINLMSVGISEEGMATLRYETAINGEIITAEKQLKKYDGDWYLTLDGSTEQRAEELRELFIAP